MRVIKFRAWDKKENKMRRWIDSMLWAAYGQVESIKQCSAVHCEASKAEDIELMQYTGLLDKNGKEIYEGDICRNGDYELDAHAYNYRVQEVKYYPEEASFGGWNFNEDGMTCEVIGNIYENPDLLNNLK